MIRDPNNVAVEIVAAPRINLLDPTTLTDPLVTVIYPSNPGVRREARLSRLHADGGQAEVDAVIAGLSGTATPPPVRTTPVAGFYRLTADLQNPLPDRRSQSWINRKLWPAGTVVRVAYSAWTRQRLNAGRTSINRPVLEPTDPLPLGTVEFPDGTQAHFNIMDSRYEQAMTATTQANLLLDHLEPAPLTLGTIVRDTGVTPAQILALALDDQLLSLDHVRTLAANMRRLEDEDKDAVNKLSKRHGLNL